MHFEEQNVIYYVESHTKVEKEETRITFPLLLIISNVFFCY